MYFYLCGLITAWCVVCFSVRLSPNNESATNIINGNGSEEKPRPLHQIQTYRFVYKKIMFDYQQLNNIHFLNTEQMFEHSKFNNFFNYQGLFQLNSIYFGKKKH